MSDLFAEIVFLTREYKVSEDSKAKLRQFKMDNGEVVKITEEEFQNVVDFFKILSNWDKELFFEAFSGSNVKLKALSPQLAKQFVGKHILIAIIVKEEIQTKHYDVYYKLEKVKLLSSKKKGEELTIEGLDGKPIEIENRRVFFS